VSRKLLALAAGAALAAGVAGCGGSHHPSGSGSSNATGSGTGTVTAPPAPPQLQVVSSLPTSGPNAALGQAVENGIRLAWVAAGKQAGGYQIDYDANDDASGGHEFSSTSEAAIARMAATDQHTILYIGDLASGASRVSIPILTAAGIPQLIPGSPATNLTGAPAGATQVGHEPEWTFLRLVPSNVVQALTMLQFLHSQPSCRILALPYGNDLDSSDLAQLVKQHSRQYGLTVVGDEKVDPTKTAKFQAYLGRLTAVRANCAIYAGTLGEGAAAVTRGLHSALAPGARIVGSSGVCTRAWTNPAKGGVPAAIDPVLYCTAPGVALSTTPAGKRFATAYEKAYGKPPDPAAAYGYEAMKLGLDAINADERRGDDRGAVLATLAHRPATDSPVGDFYFKDDGNTSSLTYTVYRVRPGGSLAPVSTAAGAG
jgi:branched-chain amino acid transport system substrate-binding protein